MSLYLLNDMKKSWKERIIRIERITQMPEWLCRPFGNCRNVVKPIQPIGARRGNWRRFRVNVVSLNMPENRMNSTSFTLNA